MGQSTIKQDVQMNKIVFGDDGCTMINTLPYMDRERALHDMYVNSFDSILHYFHRHGLSLEDMVKIIAAKAHRHNTLTHQALAANLDIAISKRKDMEKELNIQFPFLV